MTSRTYADRCPGVLRPWLAEDGAIVRLRIPGGRTTAATLLELVGIAERYADGTVLLTKRANLQLRGIPAVGGTVSDELVAAITAAGMLPSTSHELVRNVIASPLTGLVGGRLDLRPVVDALDAALVAEPGLASLGGRFLLVLDDGRGDVAGRDLDLGLVAVDDGRVQVRVGNHCWGPVVPADRAAPVLVDLTRRFRQLRGDGPGAWWHVDELPDPAAVLGADLHSRHSATEVQSPPVAPGEYRTAGGRRVDVFAVHDGLVTRGIAERLVAAVVGEVVVTPWRSLIVPETTS